MLLSDLTQKFFAIDICLRDAVQSVLGFILALRVTFTELDLISLKHLLKFTKTKLERCKAVPEYTQFPPRHSEFAVRCL
jgi:hypothetical protein